MPVYANWCSQFRTTNTGHGACRTTRSATAHEDMFKAGVAVSRNDDQIRLAIVGDVGDYFKGSAYADKHCFQELGFDCIFCQCIQLFFHGPNRKTLAHWNVSQIRRVGRGSIACSRVIFAPKCFARGTA